MANPFETHGMFSWFELVTDSQEGAKGFYEALLGWEFVQDSNNPDYTLIMSPHNPMPIAGVIEKKSLLSENKAIPSHWGCYITVASLEGVLTHVERLGGRIIVPATPIPKVGIFGVIQDPQGAVVALMEYQLEG